MDDYKPLTFGMLNAEVVIVCEPQRTDLAYPMDKGSLSLLFNLLRKLEIPKDKVLLIQQCPPIPEADKSSDKRRKAFLLPYLLKAKELIGDVKPKLIVTMGESATTYFLGKANSFSKNRGNVIQVDENKVFPITSPSQALLRPEFLPIITSDITSLKSLMNNNYESITAESNNYYWAEDIQDIIDMKPKIIAIDTETTGLDYRGGDTILTIQITYTDGVSAVCPIHKDFWDWEGREDKRQLLLSQLKTLLSDPKVLKIGQNITFDLLMLEGEGFVVRGVYADTELWAWAVDENVMQKNLDNLCKIYLPSMSGYNDYYSSIIDKSDMINLDKDIFLQYAGGDTDATFRLFKVLDDRLKLEPTQRKLLFKIKMPCLIMLKDMTKRGVEIDIDHLNTMKPELDKKLEELYEELIKLTPRRVLQFHASKGLAFTRDAFVRDILFSPDGFGLKPVLFTESTRDLPMAERVPSASANDHLPYFINQTGNAGLFVNKFIEYTKLEKLLSTYVNGFDSKYVKNGTINSSFSLSRTVTGRTASKSPNCFPGNVEILTKDGFIRFDELTKDALVAQVNTETKELTYVKPLGSMKFKADKLTTIKSDLFIDLVSTPNHRFFLENRKNGEIKWVTADAYKTDMKQLVAATYRGGDYTPSNSELIVWSAIQADGIILGTGNRVDFGLTKQRKITRLVTALSDIGRKFSVRIQNNGTTRIIVYDSHDLHKYKQFSGWPNNLSLEARKFLSDEVFHWDGDFTRRKTWASVNREDADYIQQLFVSLGKRATVKERNNASCKSFWVVNITHHLDYCLTTNISIKTEEVSPTEVYCVTTPESTIIVRNNGKVLVCGNSQNFPNRGKYAKPYKKLLRARKGYSFVSADLSQIELRLIAHEAKDPVMLDLYRNDMDIHTNTAREAMGLTFNQWHELPREVKALNRFRAKAVNFGYVYGMSSKTFRVYAKTDYGIDYTEKESKEMRDAFFRTYPALLPWHKSSIKQAQSLGYTIAIDGGIRHLPSIYSPDNGIRAYAERQSINSKVQGAASNLGLTAMLRVAKQRNPNIFPLLFIHDDDVLEVKEGFEWEAANALCWCMRYHPTKKLFNVDLLLPIKGEPDVGKNLGEMYELGDLPDEAPEWIKAIPKIDTLNPVKPSWWRDELDI